MTVLRADPRLRQAAAAILARTSSDCLPFTGAQTIKGYGTVRHNGRTEYVHIVVWEEANGPIPDGLTVEHKCRTRNCVRLAHMELVTRAENTRRGNAFRLRRASKPLTRRAA